MAAIPISDKDAREDRTGIGTLSLMTEAQVDKNDVKSIDIPSPGPRHYLNRIDKANTLSEKNAALL